jgi:leucyl aminopeptidase (aminopeptidase T)
VGAANRIVLGALAVVAGETLVILVDEARRMLGEAIADAARGAGAKVGMLVLEELAPRPVTEMPPALASALAQAQASVLLIGADDQAEAPFRRGFVELVERDRLRHAHLVGLTRRAFVSGFSAEVGRVSEMLRAVHMRLMGKARIEHTTPHGTWLDVRLGPDTRWIERDELIRPGRWANLPGGELLVLPEDVSGTFVALSSNVGLSAAGTDLRKTPLTLEIEGGRVRRVTSPDTELAAAAEHHIRSLEDLDRVAQVVLGCNPGLLEPIGEPAYDQCVPGLHLVLGFTNPNLTGAKWCSRGILALNAGGGDVFVDGAALMRGGRYLLA